MLIQSYSMMIAKTLGLHLHEATVGKETGWQMSEGDLLGYTWLDKGGIGGYKTMHQ